MAFTTESAHAFMTKAWFKLCRKRRRLALQPNMCMLKANLSKALPCRPLPIFFLTRGLCFGTAARAVSVGATGARAVSVGMLAARAVSVGMLAATAGGEIKADIQSSSESIMMHRMGEGQDTGHRNALGQITDWNLS